MSEAIAELATKKRHVFVSLAKRFVADGIDPEDCVQDATMIALRAVKDFRGESTLSSWFGTIVRNCALYTHRRKKPVFSLDEPTGEDTTFASIIRDQRASAEERIFVAQTLKALDGLPSIVRQTVKLMGIDGLTFKEVADHLQIPIGTVKARRSRGRQMLRKKLGI